MSLLEVYNLKYNNGNICETLKITEINIQIDHKDTRKFTNSLWFFTLKLYLIVFICPDLWDALERVVDQNNSHLSNLSSTSVSIRKKS